MKSDYPISTPAFEAVYSFNALQEAFRKARKAKRGKGGEPVFYRDLETNLLALSTQLRDRTYRPDPYRYFSLVNKKERLVSEASFRDRVVHHALVSAIEPVFERRFIEHSFACRKGKGSHAAVIRARKLARRHRYFLKMDIHHYFADVDHQVLLRLLGDRLYDPGIMWLCETLLAGAKVPSSEPNEPRGLPIGNLTSQFWANVYLDPLDNLISKQHGNGTYMRYMDDLLMFGRCKEALWEQKAAIGRFARQTLRLKIKDRATVVAPVTEGIPWLGFRIFPGLTRIDRHGRKRFGRKIARSIKNANSGHIAEDEEVSSAASLCGHLEQANTLELRREVIG